MGLLACLLAIGLVRPSEPPASEPGVLAASVATRADQAGIPLARSNRPYVESPRPQPTPPIAKLLAGTDPLMERGEFRAALVAIEQAVSAAKAAGDVPGIAICYRAQATVLERLQRTSDALDAWKAALAAWARAGDTPGEVEALGGQAALLFAIDAAQATALLRSAQALEVADAIRPLASAAALSQTGGRLIGCGRANEAEPLLARARRVQETLAPNSLGIVHTYNNLGEAQESRDELGAAESNYRRARVIIEQIAPRSLTAAAIYSNLGNLESDRRDFSRAEFWFRRELTIEEQAARGTRSLAGTYINLANALSQSAHARDAVPWLQRGLVILRRVAPDSSELAAAENSLGVLSQSRGLDGVAQRLLLDAVRIYDLVDPGGALEAAVYENLASLAGSIYDVDGADTWTRRAEAALETSAPTSLDHAVVLGAVAKIELFRGKTAEAAAKLARAIDIIEQQRAGIADPKARAILMDQLPDPYTEMIQARIQLNQPDLAFQTLERYRARSITELVAEHGQNATIDDAYGAPSGLLLQEDKLLAQRDVLSHQLLAIRSNDYIQRSATLSQIESIDAQKRDIEAAIREQSPHFANLKYPTPLSLRESQRALDPGTLALGFMVGRQETDLFALTSSSLSVYRLMAPAALLTREVQDLHSAIVEQTSYLDLAHTLYEQLLAPARKQIAQATRLLISQDGPLFNLPFDALVVSPPGKPAVHLTEQKPIHYCLSMSLYKELRSQPVAGPEAPVLALVAPEYPRSVETERSRAVSIAGVGSGRGPGSTRRRASTPARTLRSYYFSFHPIPEVQPQGATIRELYGKRAQVLTGKGATIPALFRYAGGARIIHLACHGMYAEGDGLSSILALTPSGGDDGLLFADAIIQKLRLHADLVMLSACEMGEGDVTRSEGLIGMTRALQYAGARTVGVTSWSVPTLSTTRLMQEFYKRLAAGMTKDEALRQAQIAVRRMPEWRRPFYWAAFQLVGDWK